MEEENITNFAELGKYLKTRIESVEKAYEDLIKPYYVEGVGLNVSYMNKKEKEEFINKRNCLLVQKQCYQEILNKITF